MILIWRQWSSWAHAPISSEWDIFLHFTFLFAERQIVSNIGKNLILRPFSVLYLKIRAPT